jgi:hypothetical protein
MLYRFALACGAILLLRRGLRRKHQETQSILPPTVLPGDTPDSEERHANGN